MTIGVSLAVHAVLAGALSWGALRSLVEPPPAPLSPAVSPPVPTGTPPMVALPTVGEGILVEEEAVDPTGEPPRVTAGEAIPRPDTGKSGHGGDPRAETPALNLADRDDRMRLSPDILSRIDRDQLQRLRVARARQSWEDRRSTTHPTELTLVVTGDGTVIERRAPSPPPPTRGALESPVAGVRGDLLGETAADVSGGAERHGGAQNGSLLAAPGEGIFQARAGTDHHRAAPIGSARPDVTQAAVAVPANDPARPKDNVDSDQEVATTVRSLVHASTAGGLAGEGHGGDGAGGEAGAGGASGAGAEARPLGAGDGDVFDLWTSDPRLANYFRKIIAKIEPLWANAFPKKDMLELRQGTVILEFTVQADGRVAVSWPPARPSGIDEFDTNSAAAIRRAGPFPPIPREWGQQSIRIRARLVYNNPIIR